MKKYQKVVEVYDLTLHISQKCGRTRTSGIRVQFETNIEAPSVDEQSSIKCKMANKPTDIDVGMYSKPDVVDGDSSQKRETENAHQDPLAAQHELLITEIEQSDGHFGSTLRSVYEGEEPDKFLQRLDMRIKNHDREIERMCNYHYQGFIESIRGLLQVRNDVEKLKDQIQSTNQSLQVSGLALMSQGDSLIKARKVQNNIAATVDCLTVCLPVLETYGKLREQMKNKRYYPALKTLEQLEHTYLPRVSKYRFAQIMCDTIPKLRESIKDASMSDLKDFLENIRKHSARIGEVAMRQAAENNNIDPALAQTKGRKRKAPNPPNPFTGELDNPSDTDIELDASHIELEDEFSAQDLVDFSPVYRCLHIYSVLGGKETFETYYRKQRRKQARLSLSPPHNMHETLDGYKKYFHDVIGFLVVEDHIMNNTTGLVTRIYMDELWDMALSKLVAVLRTHSAFCTDPDQMLQIKHLIILFCHTLRGYGFAVGQIYDLLLEIRDQYSEILMRNWIEIFNDIFEQDNYTPITVTEQEGYESITKKYPFRDEKLEEESFPKSFPFSQFVPSVYCQVKEYIYACLKFSEDLHLSHTEVDDMIRKLANVLLTRTLSGCLTTLIRQPSLSLIQLIQISINMNYLEKSCVYLEDFISNITGAEKDSVHVSRLQGTSMFKDARSEAEQQIYKKLNHKIDEFLELADYDLMMSDPEGQASGYISDLIAFLNSTFISFTNLPIKVAQTACMSACKHVSQALLDFLMDNEVRTVSMGALQQFNLDLVQCELFASSAPVPGMNEGTLQMAFTELRQLLDLFMAWDWSRYLADYGHETSKYLRVSPSTAITLLEKMKDADKRKNNLFTTFKKNERDKKKLVDTVLKQLKGLANGQPANHN